MEQSDDQMVNIFLKHFQREMSCDQKNLEVELSWALVAQYYKTDDKDNFLQLLFPAKQSRAKFLSVYNQVSKDFDFYKEHPRTNEILSNESPVRELENLLNGHKRNQWVQKIKELLEGVPELIDSSYFDGQGFKPEHVTEIRLTVGFTAECNGQLLTVYHEAPKGKEE